MASLDPSCPVTLLGFGQNGRAIFDAATRAGLDVTVFDDRHCDGVGADPFGVRFVRSLDDLSASSQWIVSPLDDASLCSRIPENIKTIRWGETLRTIVEGGPEGEYTDAPRSVGVVRNEHPPKRKAPHAAA